MGNNLISRAEAFQTALDAYNEATGADKAPCTPALNLLQCLASAIVWCRYQYPMVDFEMVAALAGIDHNLQMSICHSDQTDVILGKLRSLRHKG